MEAVIRFAFIGLMGLFLIGSSLYFIICPNSLFSDSKDKKNIYLWGIEGFLFLLIGVVGCLIKQKQFHLWREPIFFSIMFFALSILFMIMGFQQREENKQYIVSDHDQPVLATIDHIAKDSLFRHNYGKWVHLVVIYKGFDKNGKECNYRLVLEKLKNKEIYPLGSTYEVYFSRDKKIIYDLEDVKEKKSLERRYFLLSVLLILIGIIML